MDVELLIIGDGPELNNINKFIESNNLKTKVKIIKKIPNEELAQYYRSADIFALPMENLDGIPIPFLEAMACGLPVYSITKIRHHVLSQTYTYCRFKYKFQELVKFTKFLVMNIC